MQPRKKSAPISCETWPADVFCHKNIQTNNYPKMFHSIEMVFNIGEQCYNNFLTNS